MSIKKYSASCHCGAVKFEISLDLSLGTNKCNCSFCKKVRNWGVIVRPEAIKMISGDSNLTVYEFGPKTAHHHFCKTCGVRTFTKSYLEALGGDYRSVNLAIIDDLADKELCDLKVQFFDGINNNWYSSPQYTAHL